MLSNTLWKLGFIKSLQLEVVLAIATGQDVFGVLPTGYGKSLYYAYLPILFDQLSGVARGGGGGGGAGGDICPRAQGFRGAKIDNLHR